MKPRFAYVLAFALLAGGAATPALHARLDAQQPAAAAAAPAPQAPRPIDIDDIAPWKGLGASSLSNDGQWIAYRVSPLQGDSDVVIRSLSSDKEYRVAVGEGFGAAAVFSDDSAYAAVTVAPTKKAAAAAKKARKPAQNGVTIVKLADGTKTEVEKIRAFAFSRRRSSCAWPTMTCAR